MGNGQIRVHLKMFIKLLEGDVQARSELVTENARSNALRFVHEETIVVDSAGDHGVYNGQTVESHQVSHTFAVILKKRMKPCKIIVVVLIRSHHPERWSTLMTEVRVQNAEARVMAMTKVRLGNASKHALMTLIAIIVMPSLLMSWV
jgi:hypothetical protein